MARDVPNRIPLEGGANARDVGGLPTSDGRRVRPGVLIRSANLQHLTPADLGRFAELGVRQVIDLRTDVEVAAEGPGPLSAVPEVTIHHLSLFPDSSGAAQLRDDVESSEAESSAADDGSSPAASGAAGDVSELPDGGRLLPWHERERPAEVTGNPVADLYLTYLQQRPDSVIGALRAISRAEGATVVHCAAGKDRTGVVVAIALTLVGVERAAVAADYAATEAEIGAIFELLARTPTYRREVADPDSVPAPRGEVIEAVLDALESHERGLAGWLGTHGWTQSDTDRLAAALLG